MDEYGYGGIRFCPPPLDNDDTGDRLERVAIQKQVKLLKAKEWEALLENPEITKFSVNTTKVVLR